jgi:hypothetical protein
MMAVASDGKTAGAAIEPGFNFTPEPPAAPRASAQ